jgi:hypothetical protein
MSAGNHHPVAGRDSLRTKARAIPLELLKESGLAHEEYLALMKQLAPLRTGCQSKTENPLLLILTFVFRM